MTDSYLALGQVLIFIWTGFLAMVILWYVDRKIDELQSPKVTEGVKK